MDMDVSIAGRSAADGHTAFVLLSFHPLEQAWIGKTLKVSFVISAMGTNKNPRSREWGCNVDLKNVRVATAEETLMHPIRFPLDGRLHPANQQFAVARFLAPGDAFVDGNPLAVFDSHTGRVVGGTMNNSVRYPVSPDQQDISKVLPYVCGHAYACMYACMHACGHVRGYVCLRV